MSDEPSFKMSQDYELITPKKKSAYPILVEEWVHLKTKIKLISDNANLYHTVGSIFLGVSGSALVAALTLNIPDASEGVIAMPIILSWFIFISASICGVLSLVFGSKQRKVQASSADDVIQHMDLIEKRYEVEET